MKNILSLIIITITLSACATDSSLQHTSCTYEDNQYSKSNSGVEADIAFNFGLKIQKTIREKDLQALFSLVDGELSNGPRKSFVKNKSFDEVFSEEWQTTALDSRPSCRPVGWRGFMLGSIWYRANDDKLSIFSINGAIEEIHEDKKSSEWLYDGQALSGSCFTTVWGSRDNYEHFHETFANTEDYETFYKFIGKYIGRQVPLGGVDSPWEHGKDNLSLAVNILDCLKEDNEKTYEILKEISETYCESLAPNFPYGCETLRLVTVIGPCGGSLGCSKNTAIYATINEQETNATYMIPLVNFESKNDALHFVDELTKGN